MMGLTSREEDSETAAAQGRRGGGRGGGRPSGCGGVSKPGPAATARACRPTPPTLHASLHPIAPTESTPSTSILLALTVCDIEHAVRWHQAFARLADRVQLADGQPLQLDGALAGGIALQLGLPRGRGDQALDESCRGGGGGGGGGGGLVCRGWDQVPGYGRAGCLAAPTHSNAQAAAGSRRRTHGCRSRGSRGRCRRSWRTAAGSGRG